MSRRSHDTWPPLVIATDIPSWIRWRDIGLTLLMWTLFAIMLETEFELFVGPSLERLGLGDFDTNAHWPLFFERLKPFLITAAVLVVVLFVAGLLTLRRRKIALLLDRPPPLELAADARRAAMTETALAAAREMPIAVVYIENDGSHRVEAAKPPVEAQTRT